MGESFYQSAIPGLIDDLIDLGHAVVQDDNSVVVDLSKSGVDTPLLIRKSNGAHLYASSDVAALQWREQNWQPRLIIYVVGNEQKFHFRQLFAFNHLVGLTNAELRHYSYGLIEGRLPGGKRHKMSSRMGAVSLEEVLDQARATVANWSNLGLAKLIRTG